MRHTSAILFYMIAAVSAAAPALANQEHTIPIEITRSGHLIADLTLDQGTMTKAVIDTAATFPMIDDAVAETAGVHPGTFPKTVEIIGIGPVSTFPIIEIGPLRLGNLALNGANAAYNAEFDLPGAINIIPSSSIPFRTLDFDFKRSRLMAYDRRPLYVHQATTSRLPLTWTEGLPFIPVEVNDQTGLALIDTGASISYINSAFARNAARSMKDFRTLELVGATGSLVPLSVLSSRDFVLGDFEVKRFDVIVSDPEFLAAIGLQDEPVMVIGLDILSQFRLQIDRGANQVRLSQPRTRHPSVPGMTIYNSRH